jgi:hypothetical protein
MTGSSGQKADSIILRFPFIDADLHQWPVGSGQQEQI